MCFVSPGHYVWAILSPKWQCWPPPPKKIEKTNKKTKKHGWIREASPSTHTIQIIKIRHAKAITERSDFNQGVLGGRSPPSFNQNSSKIINKCEFSRNLIRKHQVTVNTRRGDPVCVPRFLKTDSEKSSGDTPRSIYIEFDSRWTAFEICCFGDMRVRP